MDNPGCYDLAVIDFSGASEWPLTAIENLQGALSVTLDVEFKWGSSSAGQTGNVKVQTSFDGGNTWRDIARFDFATTSVVKHANLEFLLSKGVTSYAALASEGVYDGVIGDRLRALPTWSGSYSGSSLTVRAAVR